MLNNLILIGMPGAGKSTVGVVLAKTIGRSFIDTDLLIQESNGKLLQDIVDELGIDKFKALESLVIESLNVKDTVIATGGSVVYSDKGMARLKTLGDVVYLKLSYDEIEKRVQNITTRGLVLAKGKTLKDLYEERFPLYEKYADLTIECDGLTIEEIISKIVQFTK